MKLMIGGKGGSGKSTVTALLANALEKRGKQVLIIDADETNIGLYKMLGADLPPSLMEGLGGKKGFQTLRKSAGTGLGAPPPLFPPGLTLNSLNQNDILKNCLAGSGRVQILSIGKIHHFGEGCACPMGNLFRLFLPSLTLKKNEVVLVDTTAGLEHFGRRLDGFCDHIISVVAPSYESITLAGRMAELANEAGLPISVILNKIDDQTLSDVSEALQGLPILGRLPHDQNLFMNNLRGQALDTEPDGMEQICRSVETLQTGI